MKEFRNKAFKLLEDIEENGLTTDEAIIRYCDLIEETFEHIRDLYGIHEGGQMNRFVETIQEIRRHCI